MAGTFQPLVENQKIVDENGKPTQYFIRFIQQKQEDIGTAITEAEAEIIAQGLIDSWASARDINTGFGLSGGGNLSADRTLSLGNPALTDPNADRILFWDDSAGQLDWLIPGTNLTITDKTIDASGGSSGGGFFSGASNTLPGIAATGAFATKGIIFKPYQDMTVERLMTWVDPNGITDQYRIQIADLSSVTIDATDPRKITAATVGTVLGSTTATAIGSTNMRMVKQALSSPVVCSSGTYYALAAVYQQASGTAVARIMGPAAGNQGTFDLNAPCDTYESAFVTTTVGISNGQALTLQTGWYCCAVEGTL